jgi:hypothetical protein
VSILLPKGKPPSEQVVKTLSNYIAICTAASAAECLTSITILVSGKFGDVKITGHSELNGTIIINSHQGIAMPEKEIKEFFEKLMFHFMTHGMEAVMQRLGINNPKP